MSTKNWANRPLYVWLFALYPILFLFSQNVGRVFESQVIISIAITLLVVTFLFALALLFSQNTAQAGAITAIITVALLTYGHVCNLSDRPGLTYFLSALYVVLPMGGIALIVWKKSAIPERATPYLSLIGIALILMTLPSIANYYYRSLVYLVYAEEASGNEHPQLRDSSKRPDIYYIILDGYSSNAQLLRDYGYDNSAFTDALEARGFYVAYDSKTTYGVTLVSLSASLNMRYIDENDQIAAQSSPSAENYFRELIADSLVAKELQAHGYTYVLMLSGFVTPSTIADVNIDFHPEGPVYFSGAEFTSPDTEMHDASWFYQRPFLPLFLETTAFSGLIEESQYIPTIVGEPYKFWEPERALMTWDEVEKIPEMPEATFTFIHIIKPHVPISFDKDGNIQPYLLPNTPEYVRKQRFFEELSFVNARTLKMLDTILERSSTPPIIILQADHGSVLGHPESRDGRRTNFEILNAYHFPEQRQCIHDQDIIPLNSFRAIFNCYFGRNYSMLEEQYYAMPANYNDLFYFEEVDIQMWQTLHEAGERE
ncbi:MAG: hypothetical protein JXB07_16285 [Anaerolineae bacterium]|nr:hypothetical protein [Anaerolineae bacterium]